MKKVPLSIDVDQSRRRWHDVIHAVTILDEPVLLTRYGLAVARVTPLASPPDPHPTLLARHHPILDDHVRLATARLRRDLGDTALHLVLHTTRAAIRVAHATGWYEERVLARHDALVDLLHTLETRLGEDHTFAWLTRPHRQLCHRTPLATLQLPWTPGDATHTHLQRLARTATVRRRS